MNIKKIERNIFSKLNRKYSKIYDRKLHKYRGFTRLQKNLIKLTEARKQTINEEDARGVLDYEFDNLIILDACRYDLYDQVVKGQVDRRVTLGSCSPEYVRKNFSKGHYDQIVYVTANPFVSDKFEESADRSEPASEVFHEVFNTVETDWCEEKGTVPAEPMARDLLTARRLFPEKKVIAHFMQPHHPFIGHDVPDSGWGFEGSGKKIWDYLVEGKISEDKFWKGYENNLRYVIEELNKILPKLEGRTIITADHGNLVGEYGLYAHPEGLKSVELREVPLHIVEDKIEVQ